ncbi:CRAL-TRIO domain-containing protein [Mycena belliarum]|uniref:CRAL-TRIO domain-containing protein n=1 Tax=Mycena belliarum TaxID=1033014 RepID=A0AAD6XJ34_9AGAR|nr:CRAL-TRIO domain-containing protein [Mycena belliae]
MTVTETVAPVQAQTKAAAEATTSTWTPPPGRLGNLTPVQEAALVKVAAELRAEGAFVEARHDDATLLRFLRARKFDVLKTKDMLLASEKWRKEFGVDELVRTFDFPELEEVDKYYPQYYHKMDKSGRPVYIERIGNLNMKALYACTSQDRLLKRLVVEYESFLTSRLAACAAAEGHPVETSLTILDLGGVSLSNFIRVKDYVFAATSIGQNMYPECMGAFYIINAPWTFTAVWAAIRPWLDEVTAAKVQIVGGPRVYRPLLLAQIDADCLPAEFGGTCACAGGCSLSDMGPWNPEGNKTASASPIASALTEKLAAPAPTEVIDVPVNGQVLSV